MKKASLFLSLFFLLYSTNMLAQKLNEMVNTGRYAEANMQLDSPSKGEKRVVFIGNSITQAWAEMRPNFFTSNHYVGRGIGGETSPQLLMRFRQDVIDLQPKAVVINIGTNDIAENTGAYNVEFTLDCIQSMAEIAQANKIKVILSSVLPVGEYPWRREIKNVPAIIDILNSRIKEYAKQKGFACIDYNAAMRDSNGAMIQDYASDGVHPNEKGYELMEVIAKKVIDKVIK